MPACVLLICLLDLGSQPVFEHHYLTAEETRKLIAERANATFSVEQYEAGPRRLLVRLPEKGKFFGFYAPVNESTLALLAQKGIACPTHVYGRHFLGLPGPQQYSSLLSMFLVAAGVVTLLKRPRQFASAALIAASAPSRQPRKSGLYESLAAIRTEPGPRRTFRRVFMTVFALALGFSILRALLALPYYAGTARLKVISADPASVFEETVAIRSPRVLGTVVEKMDLNHRWRDTYGRGAVLSSSESVSVLQWCVSLANIGPDTIAIRVYDPDAGEAAALANAIADAALDYRNQDHPRVQILEKASPALKPAWPNKPAQLLFGTLAGGLLGLIAGVGAVGLRRRRGSRS